VARSCPPTREPLSAARVAPKALFRGTANRSSAGLAPSVAHRSSTAKHMQYVHVLAVVIAVSIALALSGLGTESASASTRSRLALSMNADRSNAVRLDGSTVKGQIHVFVRDSATLDKVDFYLDGRWRKTPVRTETEPPFDFAGTAPGGTAVPYDTKRLVDGPHRIKVVLSWSDGNTSSHRANFTVANGLTTRSTTTPSAPSTTARTPAPSTAPTKTTAAAETTAPAPAQKTTATPTKSAPTATANIADSNSSAPDSSFAHINVTDYGAVGNDATDNQTALQNAFNAGKAQGKPVYVPPGTFRHSGRLSVDSVVVFGASAQQSHLKGMTVIKHAIDMTGAAPGLYNLMISGPGKSPRTSNRGGNGVYVSHADGYVIRNSHILNVSGAGIMVEAGKHGGVFGNFIELTGADGIYHTEGSAYGEVAYNRTQATGDDAISVTSYGSALGDIHDFDIHHNAVLGNFESRAITVNGGYNVNIHDNHINGGTAGLSVSSASAWSSRGTSRVTISNNTIRNINQTRQNAGLIGGGALHLWNDQPGSADFGITFSSNQIYNPGLYGVYIAGTSPITAQVINNSFYIDDKTLVRNDNASAKQVTLSKNSTATRSSYPGDKVPASIGGIDRSYKYSP
jgi:hypothetical protein